MKFVSLLVLGLFLGFFDMYYVLFFILFSIVLLFFSLYGGGFSGFLFCDSLSFFLVFLSVWIFLFCFFSSLSDTWSGNKIVGFSLILFLMFFFVFVSFMCVSFFFFYVCFEFVFLLMFYFLMSWGYSPERAQAAFYMVFYTLVVSLPFLVFILSMGRGNFVSLFFFYYDGISYWGVFFMLVFLVKLPVYLAHLWLPKAHVEAPVSGSMLLAGVLLKLGGYGLIRFFFMNGGVFLYSGYLISVGLGGGLLSCFLCLRQSDLKALVAYSSICHMGVALSGLASFKYWGLSGGLYMLVGHGFCSSCLFYVLYVVYKRCHTRSVLLMKGVSKMAPTVSLIFFVFCILNMSVPPSLSFFSEVFMWGGVGQMNIYMGIGFFLFFFFGGVYGIYLFIISNHGDSILSSLEFSLMSREFLVIYCHFFPLLFLSVSVGFLFWL